ncbi:MAG TPA: hypothetical protein VHL11_00105 [Phototrophicaceae bacterium]|nr:hypothetical protein [Phototrophicaceae bacterium]
MPSPKADGRRPISSINAMLLRRDLAKKIKNFRYTTSFPRKLVKQLQATLDATREKPEDYPALIALQQQIIEIKAVRKAAADHWR